MVVGTWEVVVGVLVTEVVGEEVVGCEEVEVEVFVGDVGDVDVDLTLKIVQTGS